MIRWAVVLLAALTGCASMRMSLAEPLPPDADLVVVRTQDGIDLPVIHYRAHGTPRARPVVLCHGLSGNARHMDLDANHSLARWLAQRGYDTWSVSLRGTWNPILPVGSHTEAKEETTIDTYAQSDLPAVFEAIQARTGAAQVDFVGHSMGGLVLYAYLARGGKAVHTGVTLGSPARFRFGGGFERFLRERGKGVLAHVDSVPDDVLADLYLPQDWLETPLELLLLNPKNMSTSTWKQFLVTGSAPMAGGVLRQFQRCLADERFESSDGSIDYLARLHDVHVPILFVAGKIDRLALPDGVKAAYTASGGERKFFIAGEESGFAHDYGHLDLLVADHAALELWPEIDSWLVTHAEVHEPKP